MRRTARAALAVAASVVLVAGGGVLAIMLSGPAGSSALPSRPTSTRSGSTPLAPTQPATPTTQAPVPPVVSPEQMAALVPADYRAVIPGLLPAPPTATWMSVFHLQADAPLYGADRRTPIARFESLDFLGAPSVVVRVAVDGPWSLVLTPSRQIRPSEADAGRSAPAQSAGWLPTSSLMAAGTVQNRIVVSVSAQSLTITDAAGRPEHTFSVGVGAQGTPTPIGVTGYLEARYLDPAQGQNVHRIQLTSLHATASDEPYGGSDGGLIGIHYEAVSSGAVSHGCVRLRAEAIDAVDALALGTPVIIVA